MTAPVFHVALASEWADARVAGRYRRSTLGLGLEDVGFVHASHARQVVPTIERFYADVRDDLVVLEIDPDRLDVPLRDDWVDAAADSFPHIYGEVAVSAVVAVHDVVWSAGSPSVPSMDADPNRTT